MQKRFPFREIVTTIASNGTLDYLKGKQVPNGEVWVIETVAYENETGARGKFRRYIERGSEKLYIAELQGPGTDELIFSDKPMTLLPDERLVVQQASCTTADVLKLYITGYRIFTAEPYLEVS